MSWFGSLFGAGKQPQVTGARTPLELVISAAALVSNPTQVDQLLDKVRVLTASLEPGQQPAPADEHMLLGIYLQLETYLTTTEPLRRFTKEELRSRVAEELRHALEAYETKG